MTVAIGSTLGGMVELSSLDIPEPKTDWNPGAEQRQLHSGKRKWIGAPTGSLSWGFLTQAQRDALRGLLPAASNNVYVHMRTREDTDAWVTYQCEAYWPEEPREPASVGHRLNFVVELGFMVEA